MDQPLAIVAISGALHEPSRTTALVEAIADEIQGRCNAVVTHLRLGERGREFGGALTRAELGESARHALEQIEQADVVVVGTPVYRGSYTGVLKHVVDLIDQTSLRDTPVLVAATGGSDHHSLVIDHELKPLFAFFEAAVLPIGVYARSDEFPEGRTGDALRARIARAVDAGLPLISARSAAGFLSVERLNSI